MTGTALKNLARQPSWEWPADAVDTIVDGLRRGTSDERRLAAELAGDTVVACDAVAEALLEVARDGELDAELRGRACIALGPMLEEMDVHSFDELDPAPISTRTFEAIGAALHAIHRDASAPVLVRRRALEAAVRAPADWQAGAIRAAWHSEAPEWKVTAVFGMQWVRGFEAEIADALESDDEALLLEALQAAASWELEAAGPLARSLVLDAQAAVELREAAIMALASVRPDEARDLLPPLLESEHQELVDAADEALTLIELLEEDV